MIALLLLLVYSPTLAWMVDRWGAHDSYYSHGYLVPFVSLYLLWIRRETLARMELKPAGWGLLLVFAGLLVHLASALLRVYFTSAFSMLLVIAGLVIAFCGMAILRETLFAILFLGFMMPLPLVAIVDITFSMKIFAAKAAAKLINAMGIRAILDGSVIRMRHTHVIVEDVCSGLRSLISLLALGAVVAYLSAKLTRLKKIIVFLAAGIIAVLANIVRIVFMAVTSEIWGAKFTEGFLHTLSGLLVFVVAFLGLIILVKELE
ncbi:MAG: exosortase/archaeosortase family protein [Deltaproteobacteria bacterium]